MIRLALAAWLALAAVAVAVEAMDPERVAAADHRRGGSTLHR